MKTENKEVLIKPYNLKQLAGLYGVCPQTMKKWIKRFESEIGTEKGRLFTKKQVEVIFDKLGHP